MPTMGIKLHSRKEKKTVTTHFEDLLVITLVVGIFLLALPVIKRTFFKTRSVSIVANPSASHNKTQSFKISANKRPTAARPEIKNTQLSVEALPSLEDHTAAYEVEKNRVQVEKEHHERIEKEFLIYNLGLSETEITLLTQEQEDHKKELRYAQKMFQTNHPNATLLKETAIQRHDQWMSSFLGDNEYQQFVNLSGGKRDS